MSSQIALLIDTNVDDIDLNQLSLVSNSICLTAFRLLHFLVAKFEKRGIEKSSKLSHTAVKWGYKFFNSRSYATRIEQHRLRDVKLKYFEEFENEVQRRIENKVQCLESAVKKIKPCDCLSKALTELLSDFPWERPDITSPIKGRKKKKETNRTTNLVVLFTTCPKSAQDFKLFTGKQVPDFEIFLDSVLPPALFHQFCNVSQLSLNWIDTAELYSQTPVLFFLYFLIKHIYPIVTNVVAWLVLCAPCIQRHIQNTFFIIVTIFNGSNFEFSPTMKI